MMAPVIDFITIAYMRVVVRITCLWLAGVQKLDITRGRSFDRARTAGRHLTAGKGAINPIEPPWSQRVGDAAHRCRRERHHIGITPKELNPAKVRRHLHNIPAQDRAASLGTVS